MAGESLGIFRRLYDVAKAEVGSRLNKNAEPQPHKTHTERNTYQPPPFEDPVPAQDSDPMAQHYSNLEVPPGSDLETVEKNWKKLLKKYHPDRHSQDAEKAKVAHELTQQLNESYQILKRHLKK